MRPAFVVIRFNSLADAAVRKPVDNTIRNRKSEFTLQCERRFVLDGYLTKRNSAAEEQIVDDMRFQSISETEPPVLRQNFQQPHGALVVRAGKTDDLTLEEYTEHSLLDALANIADVVHGVIMTMDEVEMGLIEPADLGILWERIGNWIGLLIDCVAAVHDQGETVVLQKWFPQLRTVQNDHPVRVPIQILD